MSWLTPDAIHGLCELHLDPGVYNQIAETLDRKDSKLEFLRRVETLVQNWYGTAPIGRRDLTTVRIARMIVEAYTATADVESLGYYSQWCKEQDREGTVRKGRTNPV